MNSIAIVFFAILASAFCTPISPNHIKVYKIGEEATTTTTTTTTTTPAPITTTFKTKTYASNDARTPIIFKSNDRDTITPAFVLVNSPFRCNGLKDGHYADTHYKCEFFHSCQFFYKSDGKLYVQQAAFQCGAGTRFNQTIKTCDYTNAVNCNAAVVESIIAQQLVAPTPAPGPDTSKRIPVTSFTCHPDFQKQGFYYADIDARCEVYHRCVYHTMEDVLYATQYSFFCPEGTIYNQQTINCMDPKEVKCNNSPAHVDDQAYLHPNY